MLTRAAARKLIDFSKARFDDVGWWRKLNIILRELEREQDKETNELAYQQHQVMLSLILSDTSKFSNLLKDSMEALQASYRNCLTSIRPWINFEQIQERSREDLAELYKQNLGDPNDPVYKAQIDAMLKEFQQRSAKVKHEAAQQEEKQRAILEGRHKAAELRRRKRR